MAKNFRKLKKILIYIDIFALSPKLMIKNSSQFKTFQGGLLSVIYFIISILYLINQAIDIYSRNINNSVSSLNIYNETATDHKLNYPEDMNIMFSLVDKNFVPLDISSLNFLNFTFYSNYWEENNLITNKSFSEYLVDLTLCPNSNSYLNKFKSKYTVLLKDRIFCINSPIPHFYIGGNILTGSGQYSPGVKVKLNDEIINNQTKLNQINDYIQQNFGGMIIYNTYKAIDFDDPLYGTKQFIIWNFVSFETPNLNTTISINLQNVIINKDLSLFPETNTDDKNLTLSDINISNTLGNYLSITVNINLSNIIRQLKIKASKYDIYLNRFVVVLFFLYLIFNFFITLLFSDNPVHYLISKFVRLASLEGGKKDEILPSEEHARKTIFSNFEMKQNTRKINRNDRDFNYEAADIELRNLRFVQNEEIIPSDPNENLTFDSKHNLDDLNDRSDNNQIIIDLKEDKRSEIVEMKQKKVSSQSLRKAVGSKFYNIEIVYEKHQQEFKILSNSYYDYFLFVKKKMKSKQFVNYFQYKFCGCREKNRYHVDSFNFYSNSISALLSFENLFQSLTELIKLKKVFFSDHQNEIFSSFFSNCYLPKSLDDVQLINKPDKKEIIETLTSPCIDYYESMKNRRLLEQMCQEMIACTKSIED